MHMDITDDSPEISPSSKISKEKISSPVQMKGLRSAAEVTAFTEGMTVSKSSSESNESTLRSHSNFSKSKDNIHQIEDELASNH